MTGPVRQSSDHLLRASDRERDHAADVIRRGYAEGRLTRSELEERIGAAYGAKSRRELEDLMHDLPVASSRREEDAFAIGVRSLMTEDRGDAWCGDRCLMLALLFAFPPAGIVYWVLSQRGRHRMPC